MLSKVLFVDDEPYMNNNARRAFKKKYDVHTAESAKEAIEVLKKDSGCFLAIVTDYVMKGEDGLTLLKHVEENFPNIRRILVTGCFDENLERTIKTKKTIEFVVGKPYRAKSIEKILEEF